MPGIKLCVNIDHIATVRQARGGAYPDPLEGARLCEESGAHGITVHLREDRRHIQDRDVIALKKIVQGTYNLEMALSDEIIAIAKKIRPHQVTLVPEKREEITTEGGLDVAAHFDRIRSVVGQFHDIGIIVSLFIEPEESTVMRSKESGADFIELHTGAYCNAADAAGRDPSRGMTPDVDRELGRILRAAELAVDIGIGVNAGHGLNRANLAPVLKARGLEELNIGHSIIARSIFVGLPAAVKELLDIIGR
ncbi:MAG TPA: pyridoxine 5'-phosphate synthase [Spirochaetota bacterium]|nr:pyridoxine 5'-phosphate synthase [Spirochaetota bacterium]HOD14243.1 pyridoxine 5'-phosphate synthase [Spirochaetota bacterium]HPG50687.1 pyridoxine 5'-phosphate synthase [Spirochaetota bacterium]HPO46705.1 pyridoxine 5'-phosphate synthase [Spirochaetota bacterium]HQL82893.1 pyridoxine 5'-phosphate synthase [Spirochaetota bacterium]